MKKICALPIFKRACIGKLLGISFGLLCAYLASQSDPSIWDYQNPLFWSILFNRFLLGIMIVFAGFLTVHPIFKFRLYPWLRGLFFGALVSLDLAIPVFLAPDMSSDEMSKVFWGIIITGAIYGLIIDVVATKFGGQGKALLETRD